MFVSVNYKEREVIGTLYVSEQVVCKTSITFEKGLVFMLYVDYGFNNNKHTQLHKASIFVHVD